MSRAKAVVNKENAREIYQYFAKAFYEGRLFEKNSETVSEAQKAFSELASTHGKKTGGSFEKQLQTWVNMYVPPLKWKRCLATLRQIRANQRQEVKSIKLNKSTHVLLKEYADLLKLSFQDAIYQAVTSLLFEAKKLQDPKGLSMPLEKTLPSLEEEEEQKKTLQVKLWLVVENNNKFLRGKKKAREDIEIFCLSHYDARKVKDEEGEYILTIHYDTEEELDEIIYEIYDEMESHAGDRYCFIDATISTLDGKKRW